MMAVAIPYKRPAGRNQGQPFRQRIAITGRDIIASSRVRMEPRYGTLTTRPPMLLGAVVEIGTPWRKLSTLTAEETRIWVFP